MDVQRCNRDECKLCQIDRDGCQCRVKDAGCWFCEPKKFRRPACDGLAVLEESEFRAWKKQLYDEIEQEITRTVAHYAVRSGRLQDHIYSKQELVLAAPTRQEALKIYDRLMDKSICDDAIYLWAKKKADGPPHARVSVAAAKKADNLAELLAEKGDFEGSEAQRARATEIRSKLYAKDMVVEIAVDKE